MSVERWSGVEGRQACRARLGARGWRLWRIGSEGTVLCRIGSESGEVWVIICMWCGSVVSKTRSRAARSRRASFHSDSARTYLD